MASHMEEKRKARCAGGYGASAASPPAPFFSCSPPASSLNSSHMEEMRKARCAGGYGASAASPRAPFFCSPPASSLNSVLLDFSGSFIT